MPPLSYGPRHGQVMATARELCRLDPEYLRRRVAGPRKVKAAPVRSGATSKDQIAFKLETPNSTTTGVSGKKRPQDKGGSNAV